MKRQPLDVLALVLVLMSLVASGCGSDKVSGLAPVTGTVTYQGKAVDGAGVTFIPDGGGLTGVGVTDAQGKFTISTRGQPGAQIGSCKVSVSKKSAPGAPAAPGSSATSASPLTAPPPGGELSPEEQAKVKAAMEAAAKTPAPQDGVQDLLPAKYSDAGASGLQFTVKSGQNDFKIDLQD